MKTPTDLLKDQFYTNPGEAFTTLSSANAKALLLYTEGFITACGRNWNIKTKPLGSGVVEVRLEERK